MTNATTDRPYHGRFRNQSVIIVGFGTKHETIFSNIDRKKARAFAAEHGLRTVRGIATQLPEDLAVALFGE